MTKYRDTLATITADRRMEEPGGWPAIPWRARWLTWAFFPAVLARC